MFFVIYRFQMTNLMALNAYKCMLRNLRLLVKMQDPLVLSLSNKTKIKITNLFTAKGLNSDLKCPDSPKCIEETNEGVVNLFGKVRPLLLSYSSQQIEPKIPVVTKSPPLMSALTSRPLNVIAPHNVVPSDSIGNFRYFSSPSLLRLCQIERIIYAHYSRRVMDRRVVFNYKSYPPSYMTRQHD